MRRKRKKEAEAARRAAEAQLEPWGDPEWDRARSIEVIDHVNAGFIEILRTNRCPSCEAISTITEVEKHPNHEIHERLMGRQSDAYLMWQNTHSEDCTFVLLYSFVLPQLATMYHIAIGTREVTVPKGDGTFWTDFAPVRIPAPGDPPVPE
jgi:hypothetical protein